MSAGCSRMPPNQNGGPDGLWGLGSRYTSRNLKNSPSKLAHDRVHAGLFRVDRDMHEAAEVARLDDRPVLAQHEHDPWRPHRPGTARHVRLRQADSRVAMTWRSGSGPTLRCCRLMNSSPFVATTDMSEECPP